MKAQVRKLGINAIKEASWGTHICQFYESKEDLLDILVPYFKAGLENNELCVWVTSTPPAVEEVKISLHKAVPELDIYIQCGQLEIMDYSQWYTKSGKFETEKVLDGWSRKEKQALRKGFDGLRVTGNMIWLDQKNWHLLADYEATVNRTIGQHQIIAICSYSLHTCGASQIIEVVNNHQAALIRKSGQWVYIENPERKRIEDDHRRMVPIVEQTADGIVIIDKDRNIQDGGEQAKDFTKVKILIIDDDRSTCDLITQIASKKGYEAARAFTLSEGLKKTRSEDFDIIFLDVRLPDGSGLEALSRIKETPSNPEVIILTGYGNTEGAEFAIKAGVWDYLEKPFSLRVITKTLSCAIQYRRGKQAGKRPQSLKRSSIIGNSPPMNSCFNLLGKAGKSEANVLIMGETGTGKELFARAIHENSYRADKNFIVVDCASLPDNLVEDLLFGHEKGAFTGAEQAREGLIKQADGGTLFLDEIGELPLSIQKNFLRVLQERQFRPLGSKKEIESNFRLIAATNQDLSKMVQSGNFRSDLLFRIEAITITLPPLRERTEDFKELILYFIDKICRERKERPKPVSPEFIELLSQYDWPGNVRELINTLERTIALTSDEPILFPKHLPEQIRIHILRASINKGSLDQNEFRENIDSSTSLLNWRDFQETLGRRYFEDLLRHTKGSIKEACEISGLNRTYFYQVLNKYKIPAHVCHRSSSLNS